MTHDEFIGQVQSRGRLESRGDAEKVTRATLETLGRRLAGGQPSNLAAQLPAEIGRYIGEQEGESGNGQVGLDEFFDLVAERSGSDKPAAVHHARAVIAVLQDAVTEGEIEKVRQQLPGEYDPLFESGSEGQMDT